MTALSVQQRRALKKFLGRPPVEQKGNLAESFLLKYVFVEALCRQIGNYYRERAGGRKKAISQSHEAIQIDVVGRSFAYFGIQLQPGRLAEVLDSSLAKRGQKSARNLRNGIVHRWDEMDVAEASKRHFNLCSTLDALVNAVARCANTSAR